MEWSNRAEQENFCMIMPRKNPILYLKDPAGHDLNDEEIMMKAINELNQQRYKLVGDTEIQTRISQYEMAARMQTSVPDLTDFSDENESTYELYGEDARKPGTFASNCLMARRMAERGVRVSSYIVSKSF